MQCRCSVADIAGGWFCAAHRGAVLRVCGYEGHLAGSAVFVCATVKAMVAAC